ncbi:hypothetical protein V1514DRAFT_335274 [Lipomyces japonicus]|uniref:uncharacterized protein n=1 Tax=Lipomyces japonicus TaxID=56871 RepID=UPI0034CD3AD3
MDEESILSFLTEHAQLVDVITRREFISLFPRDKRSDRLVTELYHDLAATRARQVKVVAKNIKLECSITKRLIPAIVAAENEAEIGNGDDENLIYAKLLPPSRDQPQLQLHDLLQYMEEAIEFLSNELEAIDRSSVETQARIDAVVESLSDLQYKKLAPTVADETISAIDNMRHRLKGSIALSRIKK